MRVLSHPMRLDNAGSMVTIDDGSDRHAAELAGVIIATGVAERPLAPEYGLPDPTASGVSASVVAAAVTRCEPELEVVSTTVTAGTGETSTVQLSVIWAE
jgi:hypothetical protein